MAKQPQKQPATGLSPLAPLEFCPPERAARLLTCEVEDIYHWAAVGAITLYAEFYDYEIGGKDYAIFVDEIHFHHEEPPTNFNSLPTVDGGRERSYYQSGYQYNAAIGLPRPEDGWRHREVNITGLWALTPYDIAQIQSPPLYEDICWTLTTRFVGNELPQWWREGDPLGIDLSGAVIPNMQKRLRVVREDLLKIQAHMKSGTVMNKVTSEPRREWGNPYMGESQPHPTAEYHASTRERVLVAALHARSRWPDECVTYVAWANALWDHSNELFGGNDAPLSRESIQRLLSAAEGRNEVYKRS